ncbi:EpsG family protein, partial [Acinetobacter baumannii]|uniref:EpsG family protein n=3 Tax=Acinetobacter baumannii TaxID=470 RepID=UPI00095C86F1
CVLCIITIILTFFDSRQKLIYVFLWICLITWSIVSRNAVLQQDMLVYSEAMTYDWSFYKTFYTLREPVYWLSSKYLFELLHSNVLVFIILDTIFLSALVFAGYKYKIKPYFILLFILFFPNLMGFLNIYRQFLATIALFICFFMLYHNLNGSRLIYLVSLFIHNVSIVFLPILFIKKTFFQFLFIVFSFISIALMVFFSGSKSEVDTGEVSPFLFLAVICIIVTIFLFLNKLVLYRKNIDLYYINFYCVLVSAFSSLFLAGAPAKRICMIALSFLLYSIYWFIEDNRKNILLFRIILVVFSLIPTFIFSSAFLMLLNKTT